MDVYTIIGLILTLFGTAISTISVIINKEKLRKLIITAACFLGIGMIFTYFGNIVGKKDLLLSNSNLEAANLSLKLDLENFEDRIIKIMKESDTPDSAKISDLYNDYLYWSKETKEKQESELYKISRPKVKIEVTENNSNSIRVRITSTAEKSEKIDNLFMKFDIPGVYKELGHINKERVGAFTVTPSFLSSTGDSIDAQTIHISISDLFPTGYIAFNVIYRPTKKRAQIKGPFIKEHMPLMNLHDISKFSVFWDFNETQQKDDYYLDLSHLNYIIEDNKQLITFRTIMKAPLAKYLKLNGVHSSFIKEQIFKGITEFSFKVEGQAGWDSDDFVEVKKDTVFLISNNHTLWEFKTLEDVKKYELKRKVW